MDLLGEVPAVIILRGFAPMEMHILGAGNRAFCKQVCPPLGATVLLPVALVGRLNMASDL